MSYSPAPSLSLSLEPILRCPRCGKAYNASWLQQGVAIHECQRQVCLQRWWAMLLTRGPIFPQLSRTFEDEALARLLIETYHMPAELHERRYWQLALHRKEAAAHRESPPAELFRSMLLLPKSTVFT
jgi:hypothetical protein